MQGNPNTFQDIPKVVVTPIGIFKYIIISGKVVQNGKQSSITFVRGDKNLEYHADNFQSFMNEIKKKGFQIKSKKIDSGTFVASKGNIKISFKCLGGGRIEHNYNGNKCFVYGYSKSYGRVDHKIAQVLIAQSLNYPLNQIKTSQEGY